MTTLWHQRMQLSAIKSALTTKYWRLDDHFSDMFAILVEKCSVMAFLRLLMSISSAVFPSSLTLFFYFGIVFTKKKKVYIALHANLVMRMCYVFRPGSGLFWRYILTKGMIEVPKRSQMVLYRCENPSLQSIIKGEAALTAGKKKKKKKSIPPSELTALAGKTVEITVVEAPI